jgi:hypothetical protein
MDTTSHLSEPDARKITRAIVTHLRAMKAQVRDFAISLDAEGFWFVADINGEQVGCRCPQGHFTYQEVAADMLACRLSYDIAPQQH